MSAFGQKQKLSAGEILVILNIDRRPDLKMENWIMAARQF